MQKITMVVLALLAVAMAAPQGQQPQPDPVYVVNQHSDVNPEGYQFGFETSDGTSRQEQGTLKQISEDHRAIEVTGSYRYVRPDGQVYSVSFTADENGFKPQEHLESQHQQ